MLMVISPAKTLDFDTAPVTRRTTKPQMLDQSQQLVKQLRGYSTKELGKLMQLSEKLSQLNHDRYQNWTHNFSLENAKQAVLAMRGDVYSGLDADSFNQDNFRFAQKHLRILSGLYGVLRPLDLMQAYRLEMGTKLITDQGKDLYQFWGDSITQQINSALKNQSDDVLVNLASNEYFKSIRPKKLIGQIVTPQFKEKKNGSYKMIGVFAKKARGMMARYIITNKITSIEKLKDFSEAGYRYNKTLSKDEAPVFTRAQ